MNATLKYSYLWKDIRILKPLTINMRLQMQGNNLHSMFVNQLDEIGTGKLLDILL